MTEPMPLDVSRALKMPGTLERLGTFAGRLSYIQAVSSTNSVAMDMLVAGAPDGTSVLASEQTAGRGRRGRSWYSPDGAGLYLSVILRSTQSSLVTLLAGVAVAEGIRQATSLPVELEWPNDLVIAGRRRHADRQLRSKVGGILSESQPGGSDCDDVVVGIGVNLAVTRYPEEISARASSLEAESGKAVDRGTILVEVLASLARWREGYIVDGGAAMLARWREWSPSSVGSYVGWTAAGGERRGVTDGVEADGSLRVRSNDQIERLIGGTLTWLPGGESDQVGC